MPPLIGGKKSKTPQPKKVKSPVFEDETEEGTDENVGGGTMRKRVTQSMSAAELKKRNASRHSEAPPGFVEGIEAANSLVGLISALMFTVAIAERPNMVPENLTLRTFTKVAYHYEPFREFVVETLDAEDFGTYAYEPFDFIVNLGGGNALDTRATFLDSDLWPTSGAGDGQLSNNDNWIGTAERKSSIEYLYEHFNVVKMNAFIRFHTSDLAVLLKTIHEPERYLTWATCTLFFCVFSTILVQLAISQARYSYQMFIRVNVEIIIMLLATSVLMGGGVVFFFVAQQRALIDQNPFDTEKDISDVIPFVGYMIPMMVGAYLFTIFIVDQAKKRFPQWREGVEVYSNGGEEGMWNSHPGERLVLRANVAACPCLVGRCGGFLLDPEETECVPTELEDKGLDQDTWKIWMDRLKDVQKKNARRWDCVRFFQCLACVFLCPVFGLLGRLGCCCPARKDPMQVALGRYLDDFNKEVLEPIGAYAKIFTFKEMHKDGHDREGVTLSVLAFALTPEEAKVMRGEGALQHGAIQTDSSWAHWDWPMHAKRAV